MIRKELIKYLEDEVQLLSNDKVENQITHIKNLQTSLELLITIYNENTIIHPEKERIKQN